MTLQRDLMMTPFGGVGMQSIKGQTRYPAALFHYRHAMLHGIHSVFSLPVIIRMLTRGVQRNGNDDMGTTSHCLPPWPNRPSKQSPREAPKCPSMHCLPAPPGRHV